MRKVYFLRYNEEDGAVLDALVRQGVDPDELENPVCPYCGRGLLPAYATANDFHVVTWICLTPEDESAAPRNWFLVCSSFTCEYEEIVDRVPDPTGACIFDIEESHLAFDDETGLVSGGPDHLQRLVDYLQQRRAWRPSRKLDCFLEEARGRHGHELLEVQNWLRQIPEGHQVRFRTGDREIQGRLIAATDEGLLVQSATSGEWLVLSATAIRHYGPRFFGTDAELPPDETPGDGHSIVMMPADFVVMQGYHLQLSHVDRFGRYYVCSGDERAARALNLKPVAERIWEGLFRRTEIDGRYERQSLVKVGGNWVELFGPTEQKDVVAIRTPERDVARALKLKPWRSWGEMAVPPAKRTICFWYGFVDRRQIEEEKEMRLYHWPLPEAGGASRDEAGRQV